MPYALFGLITMVLWVFCIVDAITRDDAYIQYLPKVVWILIIIFIPTLGSIVWLVVGRGHTAPRGYVGPTGYGEYERPGRAVAQDPAADEAFLRQCRERAGEQRRIGRAQPRAEGEPARAENEEHAVHLQGVIVVNAARPANN